MQTLFLDTRLRQEPVNYYKLLSCYVPPNIPEVVIFFYLPELLFHVSCDFTGFVKYSLSDTSIGQILRTNSNDDDADGFFDDGRYEMINGRLDDHP